MHAAPAQRRLHQSESPIAGDQRTGRRWWALARIQVDLCASSRAGQAVGPTHAAAWPQGTLMVGASGWRRDTGPRESCALEPSANWSGSSGWSRGSGPWSANGVAMTSTPGLRECRAGSTAELRNFATSLEQEDAAVRAALTLSWTLGSVEGSVNKLIKRSGYGRMKIDLLKLRAPQAVQRGRRGALLALAQSDRATFKRIDVMRADERRSLARQLEGTGDAEARSRHWDHQRRCSKPQ